MCSLNNKWRRRHREEVNRKRYLKKHPSSMLKDSKIGASNLDDNFAGAMEFTLGRGTVRFRQNRLIHYYPQGSARAKEGKRILQQKGKGE